MQYLDKLKKERSIDRVIFLAGMILAFIGFIIPTVYIKQMVVESDLTAIVSEPTTVESEEVSESEELVAEESDEDFDAIEESDDDFAVADYEDEGEYKFVHFASKKEITIDYKKKFEKDVYGMPVTNSDGSQKFEYILDKSGNKILTKTVDYKYVIVDAEIDDEEEYVLDENGKPKLTYLLDFDKDGNKLLDEYGDEAFIRVEPSKLEGVQVPKTNLFNVFGAAEVLNQHGYDYGDYDYVPGTAYNSTFLIIVWLCTIAGIILFFVTKTIVGDILVVLLALAFGIASLVTIPITLNVTPIFGYFSVGGYLVAIGVVVAIIGTVLGAAHIQHPDQVKSN